ncbi:MAG: spoIIIJ-associated protein [Clostridia bacterium]|jgi:spoIIIJ-associated protein|uniref:RNA-binding protein KhpB n=1 Tax=Thermacetogenium phaeum TaxID=85874 RepID=A0A101FHN4_9THEO|nr:MAG: Protein Jag [Thermacetogenium phaeum]MDK2881382.1 spoIIIJ-associated protein [Clostridia bacterium]MDN5366199.1 spoIIIJ-associated protein [Thermacetogenium sp.]
MKEMIVEGSSVEEAVEKALKELSVGRNDVEIKVLEEGSRGFLGIIGAKSARVRVRVVDRPDVVIRSFLKEVIDKMELDVEQRIWFEDGYWRVELYGTDIRHLIGRHGETLNALQLLANLAVSKRLQERVRIILDAEGYREKREKVLRKLARRVADRVKRTKRDYTLEPMPPQERRIIHLELQDEKNVYTVSRGQEPYRRLAVCYKRNGLLEEEEK